MDKEFGKEFRKARINADFHTADSDYNGDRINDHLAKLDEGYIPEELSMSIYEGFYIANKIGIDFGSFMDGYIKPAKSITEIVEYWEPNGKGTLEQRVARLVAHGIITFGRGCEIFDRVKLDGLPEVDTTLCNCSNCQLLILNKCKYFYE